MVLYYIFLLILFIVYFFFAYDLTLRLEIDFNSIKVKVFYITIFNKNGDKYYKFLQKFIPKDQNQIKEEIDMTSLITLIHIKYLSINIDKKISDYLNYAYLVQVTSILNYMFSPYIKDYVEHYKFKVDENEQNNVKVKSIFKFNVGIILINMWIIKRRYRHV